MIDELPSSMITNCDYYFSESIEIRLDQQIGNNNITIGDIMEISFDLRLNESCQREWCHLIHIGYEWIRLPLINVASSSGGLEIQFSDTISWNNGYPVTHSYLVSTLIDATYHHLYFKWSSSERIFVFDNITYRNEINGNYDITQYINKQYPLSIVDKWSPNIIKGDIKNLCIKSTIPTLPTMTPSISPTHTPTTYEPTTFNPSINPTTSPPTTNQPTTSIPTTSKPTSNPSISPTTSEPTTSPSFNPTILPSIYPSMNPSLNPNTVPPISTIPTTSAPTTGTTNPSKAPRIAPTVIPTASTPSGVNIQISASISYRNTTTITDQVLNDSDVLQKINIILILIVIICCMIVCLFIIKTRRTKHVLEDDNTATTMAMPQTQINLEKRAQIRSNSIHSTSIHQIDTIPDGVDINNNKHELKRIKREKTDLSVYKMEGIINNQYDVNNNDNNTQTTNCDIAVPMDDTYNTPNMINNNTHNLQQSNSRIESNYSYHGNNNYIHNENITHTPFFNGDNV